MENKVSSKTIEVHTRPYVNIPIRKIDVSGMSVNSIRALSQALYKEFSYKFYTVILIEK